MTSHDEARASIALDGDTHHCPHTADGSVCDACLGRLPTEIDAGMSEADSVQDVIRRIDAPGV